MNKTINRALFIHAGIVLFSALSFVLSLNKTLNYDEFFSMNWTALPWNGMWDRVTDDVHPPLYYIGLKLFRSAFGGGILQARLFSWLPFVGILCISEFIRKEFGNKSALWYLLFLCGNPFMFQKSVEVRMYSWTALWVLLNGIFFYLLLCRDEWKLWAGFCLTGLAAAYNHYFALLLMVFIYSGLGVWLSFARKKKAVLHWLFMCAATVILYLPWLPAALRQVTGVNHEFWVEWPGSRLGVFRDLFYNYFVRTESIYMLLLLLFPVVSLFRLVKGEKRERAWWSLVLTGGIWGIWLTGTLYMNISGRPILVSRYMIPGVILLILGSCAVMEKAPVWITAGLCALFILVGCEAYGGLIFAQTKHTTEKTVEFATAHIQKGDTIYYLDDDFGYLDACAKFYLPWTDSVKIREDEELPEKLSGRTWYWETDRTADDSRNLAMKTGMVFKGEFAFGTERMKMYAYE